MSRLQGCPAWRLRGRGFCRIIRKSRRNAVGLVVCARLEYAPYGDIENGPRGVLCGDRASGRQNQRVLHTALSSGDSREPGARADYVRMLRRVYTIHQEQKMHRTAGSPRRARAIHSPELPIYIRRTRAGNRLSSLRHRERGEIKERLMTNRRAARSSFFSNFRDSKAMRTGSADSSP